MLDSNMPDTQPLIMTPGSIFLSRKPHFSVNSSDFCHYKLENLPTKDYVDASPTTKRTSMNVNLNALKNEVDPYVHASNWLPQFKAICRGYLARKNYKELVKKDEAVRVIQNAASQFVDPWFQLFHHIRSTMHIMKMDELKNYLRECIIQIKKLNAERMFIETQLDEVEGTIDKSLCITDKNFLSLEGRKSPNIFGKISEIKANANNDNFLKECLDLKIEGLDNVDVNFDEISCQDSKIHSVYEKSDKLQLKMFGNQHKLNEALTKCENLEKEIKDLRSSNTSLDSTSRIMKGIIHKHDREKEEQVNKLSEYEERLQKSAEEKKQNLSKIKENEILLSEKIEILDELSKKCEYLDKELGKKIKSYNNISQEKSVLEKRVKELEEAVSYSNEIQQELESNMELQKTRMKEMKKRFMDQIKNTEEDLLFEKNASKSFIHDLNEQNETLLESIKQNEATIRRLEREIKDSKEREGSDEDIDHEKERKLNMQLKNSIANMDSLKEELKITENNYEETKRKYQDLESQLEKANHQETEFRKQVERLKSQMQSLKSNFSETELNLNRTNREKNYLNQKLTQGRELNEKLESEISKMKEEMNTQSLLLNMKVKELENVEDEFTTMKKETESKIGFLEELNAEARADNKMMTEKLIQTQEELKRSTETYKAEIEEQRQLLEEKEIEQENVLMENMKLSQMIKKLQKRVEEQDEIQTENEKTIQKLKEENKSLNEEKDIPNIISVMDYRTHDYLNRDNWVSRSTSAVRNPAGGLNTGSSTLPRSSTVRQKHHLLE